MISLIIDTETTGLPRNYNAPWWDVKNWPKAVSIAAVLIQNGAIRESRHWYVKTDPSEVSIGAQKVHKIDPGLLVNGENPDDVMRALVLMATNNGVSHIVMHNVDFDRNIIGAMAARCGLKDAWEHQILDTFPFHCTMKTHTDILCIPSRRGYKWPSLEECYRYYFGEGISGAHDALSDAKATAQVFIEQCKRHPETVDKVLDG